MADTGLAEDGARQVYDRLKALDLRACLDGRLEQVKVGAVEVAGEHVVLHQVVRDGGARCLRFG